MVATDVGPLSGASVTASQELTAVEEVITTVDHKVTGRLFIGFSLLFSTATLVAWALAQIGTKDPLLGAWSTGIGTSARYGIISLGLLPLLVGLGMYLVPLQIGAKSLSFPRAANFALWSWVVSAVLFVVSVANDGGLGGRSNEMSRLGMLSFAGQLVAVGLGFVVVMTTAMTLRTHGMNLRRVPMFSYSFLVSGFVWLITIATTVSAVVIEQAVHSDASALRENLVPRLQLLGLAPTLLALAIPVLGVAADVLVTMSGRRLMNRDIFQDLMVAFGLGTIGIFAIKTTGAMNNPVWAVMALLCGLATLGFLGGLALHLKGGLKMSSAAALSAVSLVLLGLGCLDGVLAALNNLGHVSSKGKGLLGLSAASELTTWAQPGLIISAAVAALLAAVYHWGPKIFGTSSGQPLGLLSAGLVLLAGLLWGVAGSIAAWSNGSADLLNWMTVIAVALLAVAVAGSGSAALRGRGEAKADPWSGQTLEWSIASPPPFDNFAGDEPRVTSAAPLLDEPSAAGES